MQPLHQLVALAAVPLEDVALAIAADEHPHLKPQRCRRQLDVLAAPLVASLSGALAGERLDALCAHVYGELGFRGNDDYDDPANNYLSDVIARRLGNPATLAVVLVAVGHRAGLAVEPIAFPGHTLVRLGELYADPFDGGHPLPRERLLALATETLGNVADAERSLEPAGPRTMAVRILLNLQRIHRLRADHARSLVVCDRLFELTAAPCHRADRGAHALALGATRASLDDFAAYLEARPDAPDAEQVRAVMAEARKLLTPPS